MEMECFMSQMICADCGTVGKPKSVVKGSFLIEVILWLCFLIPGIIYSLWRMSSRHKACRECGSTTMVPVDSPRGKKLVDEYTTDKEPPSVFDKLSS